MTIPQSDTLSTRAMNRVFDTKTSTYKYYWLLALLDMHVKEEQNEMLALDLASRMVAYAWYPIEYFKLSFGNGDSMSKIIPEVAKLTGITVDDQLANKKKTIIEKVKKQKEVRNEVMKLTQYVPYRFLYPWINTTDNKEMVRRSQTLENDCLYSLKEQGEDLAVTINPRWSEYLKTNYEILRDFAFWNLAKFLQAKNPNVPNIAGKLIRPEKRESLTKQKNFWNKVIELGGSLHCIYKDTELGIGQFALDHFMPWSFVSHNQNWNLIPADSSFNSSKNNSIPDLDYYLPKMTAMQHRALRLYVPTINEEKEVDAVLNDYYALGASPQELMQMTDEAFYDIYRKTFSPLSQMAANMGFRTLIPA